jgi:hypothetical protein
MTLAQLQEHADAVLIVQVLVRTRTGRPATPHNLCCLLASLRSRGMITES